jgi:hypothetical protein
MNADFEKRHSELESLYAEIMGDLTAFNEIAVTRKADPFTRRTQYRVTFSCNEAHLTHLKLSALLFATPIPDPFSLAEKLALQDLESYVSQSGDIKTRSARISLKENIAFAFKAFARSIRRSYVVDFGTRDGQRFLEAIKVRDRITHPKNIESWNITDEECKLCSEAYVWFSKHLVEVSKIR